MAFKPDTAFIPMIESKDEIYSLYVITDSLSDKIYIGVTNNFLRRCSEHKRQAKVKSPKQYIHRAMAKYGIGNFCFQLLEDRLTLKEAMHKELRLVALYNTTDSRFGYNGRKGGDFVHPRLSGKLHPLYKSNKMFGSDDIRKEMRIRWNSGVYDGNKRKVRCQDKEGNILYFNSIKEACVYTGALTGGVTRACQGQIGSSKGYKWEYDEPLNSTNR